MQVPGYLAAQDALKAKGIDEVLVYCVNDPAVMAAWADDQKIAGSMVSFFSDQGSNLSEALGTTLTHDGVMRALGNPRCKRFAFYSDDGVIKAFHVSETPDDPTGDGDISASAVEGMLKVI